jgi:peptidoglycan/LPS O-acetylase OafA/YrhL
MGIAVIITLLVSFRERLNRQNKLAQTLAADAYAVFTFHPLVIVPLALAFRDIAIEMGVKFIIVAPLALIACFIVGHAIRQLPGARNVF